MFCFDRDFETLSWDIYANIFSYILPLFSPHSDVWCPCDCSYVTRTACHGLYTGLYCWSFSNNSGCFAGFMSRSHCRGLLLICSLPSLLCPLLPEWAEPLCCRVTVLLGSQGNPVLSSLCFQLFQLAKFPFSSFLWVKLYVFIPSVLKLTLTLTLKPQSMVLLVSIFTQTHRTCRRS